MAVRYVITLGISRFGGEESWDYCDSRNRALVVRYCRPSFPPLCIRISRQCTGGVRMKEGTIEYLVSGSDRLSGFRDVTMGRPSYFPASAISVQLGFMSGRLFWGKEMWVDVHKAPGGPNVGGPGM